MFCKTLSTEKIMFCESRRDDDKDKDNDDDDKDKDNDNAHLRATFKHQF